MNNEHTITMTSFGLKDLARSHINYTSENVNLLKEERKWIIAERPQ
jgi:hypothetical protein